MSQHVLEAAKWLDFGFISSFASKVATAVRDIAQSIRTARNIRATVNELNQLTDAELRDIGINRGMIISIAYESHTGKTHD